jgi:hypothetical protein
VMFTGHARLRPFRLSDLPSFAATPGNSGESP